LQIVWMHRVYLEQRDSFSCGENGCNHSLISGRLMGLGINFINNKIKDIANENLNS